MRPEAAAEASRERQRKYTEGQADVEWPMISHHLRKAQVDEDLRVADPQQDRDDTRLCENMGKPCEALHSIVKVLEQAEVWMARSVEDREGRGAARTEIAFLEFTIQCNLFLLVVDHLFTEVSAGELEPSDQIIVDRIKVVFDLLIVMTIFVYHEAWYDDANEDQWDHDS